MDVAVLLIDPNKIISSYKMPLALRGHTIVNIEDDVFMLIGGQNSSEHIFKETFLLKIGTMEWTEGPPLNIARHDHTSGLITDQITQKKSVVVVGGINSGGQVLTSIEILPLPMPDTLTDGQWQITGTTPNCFH